MDETPAPSCGPALFDKMIEAVGCFGPDGTILYLNPVTCRMMGRVAADVIGKTVWNLLPDTAESPFRDAFERAVRTGEGQHLESFYPPWGRWFLSHIYVAEGKVWLFS